MPEPLADQRLSAAEQVQANRLLARLVRSQDAIEQALNVLDHLASSGNLAALDGFLEDFDENFNAITRPDLMAMIANLMMLLGALSQIDYAPFFALATRTPDAVNAAFERLGTRNDKLGLREALALIRTPEVAAALQMSVDVLRSLKPRTTPMETVHPFPDR
jgi:uncharacterized protein YjgD (DUF1641 family)